VLRRDTEANALGVQRAIAPEVTNELSQVSRHATWHEGSVIRCPVGVGKRRQLHLGWISDHSAEHHRNAVAGANIAEAAPSPLPIAIHNLDAMHCCALNPVSATRFHCDDRLCTIDEESGRLSGSLVCGDI